MDVLHHPLLSLSKPSTKSSYIVTDASLILFPQHEVDPSCSTISILLILFLLCLALLLLNLQTANGVSHEEEDTTANGEDVSVSMKARGDSVSILLTSSSE